MALTESEQAAFAELAKKAGEAPPPPRTLPEILHAIVNAVHGHGSQASADLHTAVDKLSESPAPQPGPEDDSPKEGS